MHREGVVTEGKGGSTEELTVNSLSQCLVGRQGGLHALMISVVFRHASPQIRAWKKRRNVGKIDGAIIHGLILYDVS